MQDLIKMKLNMDGSLSIILEPELKLQLETEFSEIVGKQFEPMRKWFDDKSVPQSEKDKYSNNLTRALAEMNFLYQLLKRCGATDEEIKEWANLPF